MPSVFFKSIAVALCMLYTHFTSACAEEPPVKYAPAGTVGIPEPSWYTFLFSSQGRVAAATHYRPFLVLSEEDSIEEVERQIHETRPLLFDSPRIWIPEWPKDVDFSKEIQTAKVAQEAIRTDRLTALQQVWEDHGHPNDSDEPPVPRSLNMYLSFHGTTENPWLNVTIKDTRKTPPESISMTFRGQERRLGRFSERSGTTRMINIEFYSNGVPFILHSGSSDGIVGWQIRWLPDGKVARAIYLEEPWSPPSDEKNDEN